MRKPEIGDIWYRYEGVAWAPPVDEFDNCIGRGHRTVELRKYKVVGITPKGVWVSFYGLNRTLVCDHFKKKHAHPTQQLALEAFIARKHRQIRIIEAQLGRAAEFKALAEAMLERARV